MRELLDDELRRRLLNYNEEPDERLWKKITTSIPSLEKIPRWTILTPRLAALATVIMLAGLEFFQGDVKQSDDVISLNENEKEQILPYDSVNESESHTFQREDISKSTNDKLSEVSGKNKLNRNGINTTTLRSNKPRNLVSGISNGSTNSIVKDESALNNSQEKNGNETDQGIPVVLLPDRLADSKSVTHVSNDDEVEGAEKEKVKGLKKGNFYFLVMPTFGYNRVESNRNDNVIIQSINRVPTFSFKRLGVRLEAGIEYPLSERFKLSGGVLYYQRKQAIDYVERIVDSMRVVSAVESEVSLTPVYSYVNKSIEYELKNIGVHAGLNFLLYKGKFLHSVGTGMEFQKSLKSFNGAERLTDDAESLTYVFYNLYYRMQYPAEGKLKAVFQPTLNYSFYLDNNFQAPFYVKPYGLGLSVGLTYNF